MKNKVIYTLAIFLMIFLPNITFAESDNNYQIENYEVDVVINENNVYNVNIKIDVKFLDNMHYIIVKIPKIKSNSILFDHAATIKNLNANTMFSIKDFEDYQFVELRTTNSMYYGNFTYLLSYDYDFHKDYNKSKDEVNYYLINSSFLPEVNNFKFSIKMPKDFNHSDLHFIAENDEDNSIINNLKYSVDGNLIVGNYDGALPSDQSIKMTIDLPDKYFVKNHSIDIHFIIYLIICLIALTISYILWKKYGEDIVMPSKYVYYPPQSVNINSAEIQYIKDGYSSDKGVISLIIYLANKGYLKIQKIKDKEYRLTKLKDYNGFNSCENQFMNAMFFVKDIITLDDLKGRFFTTIGDIKDKLNRNDQKIFESTYYKNKKANIIIVLIIIMMLLIIFASPIVRFIQNTEKAYDYNVLSQIIILNIIIIGVLHLDIIFLFIFNNSPLLSKIVKFILVVVSLFIFCVALFFMKNNLISYYLNNKINILYDVIGYITLIGLLIFYVLMPKRTQYGSYVDGIIDDFIEFIEDAKEEKLKFIMRRNTSYFYDVLPYLYSLEIMDNSIKNFEDLDYYLPDWYEAEDINTYKEFKTEFNSFMNCFKRAGMRKTK